MADFYNLDLEKYTLVQLKESIRKREMIPSRIMLKDNLQANFDLLMANGISNLKGLIDSLKNKQKVEGLSKKTGLSIEYLTLLKREANSYVAKPVALNKFIEIDKHHIALLSQLGIKNSKQLLKAAGTQDERRLLLDQSGLSQKSLDELIGLSDLVRLYGVGPAFARILFDIGVDSVTVFLKSDPDSLVKAYEEKYGRKADFTAADLRFSLEIAQFLKCIVS